MGYPIEVFFDDRSATSKAPGPVVGATVILAEKGPETPVLLFPGEESRAVGLFGVPKIGNEHIWDVIEYNKQFPVWVSAPSSKGRYGGVMVGTSGSEAFSASKTTKTIANFSQVQNVRAIAVADGVEDTFTLVLPDIGDYKPLSIKVLKDNVALAITATAGTNIETLSGGGLSSGTLQLSGGSPAGELEIAFTIPPTAGSVLEVEYIVNTYDGFYFAIFNKNPQADDLRVLVTKPATGTGLFTLDVQKLDAITGAYKTLSSFPQTMSMVPNTKGPTGKNIYGPVLFANNDYFEVVVNSAATYSTFTVDTSYVAFAGGKRGTSGSTDLVRAWGYYTDKQKYKVKTFFDVSADADVAAEMLSLRQNNQLYSDFLVPLPESSAADAITAKQALSIDNRGVKIFATGFADVASSYTGETIGVSLMGRVANNYSIIALDAFGGLAPAWYNAAGKYGGQLGSGIDALHVNFNDTEVSLLKDARINPVVADPSFGIVIVAHFTSQSLESDYAYQAHSGLADYLVSNIVGGILPFQLSKPNDDYHRTTIKSQIESLVRSASRFGASSLITQFLVVCDDTNNTADVLAARQFIVDVYVQFTPTSEVIKLNFINTAQGTLVG